MFTIFATNTIAWASQVQKNFEHIASGDRLPMSGVSLTAANLTYNIGSESYYWKNLYTYNLEYDYIEGTKQLLVDQQISITAFDIQVDGLNGDAYNFFEISVFCQFNERTISATANDDVLLWFNDSYSAFHFNAQSYYDFVGGAVLAQAGNSIGFVLGKIFRSSSSWQGDAKITLKSDVYKQGTCYSNDSENTSCITSFIHDTNTSDTVTSLNFESVGFAFAPTFTSVYIQIWGIK